MLYTDYRKDRMSALKNKDILKKNVLTNLLSALDYVAKDLGRDLDASECEQVLLKEIKKLEESFTMASSRPDKQEDILKEINILKEYAPKQMDDDELLMAIKDVIQELGLEAEQKNKGLIMKNTMQNLKGKADGKRISAMVDTIVNG